VTGLKPSLRDLMSKLPLFIWPECVSTKLCLNNKKTSANGWTNAYASGHSITPTLSKTMSLPFRYRTL
jgi:hypothetical protein